MQVIKSKASSVYAARRLGRLRIRHDLIIYIKFDLITFIHITKRYSTPQYSCFTLETLVVEIVTRLASFGIDGQGYSKDRVSTQQPIIIPKLK